MQPSEWQCGMGQPAACPSAGLPRSICVTWLPADAAPAAPPAAPPRTPRAPCTQAAAGLVERPQSAPPAAPLSPLAYQHTPEPPAPGAPSKMGGTPSAPSPCAPCKRKRGAHAAAAARMRELQSGAARVPGAALLPRGQLEPGASICSRKVRHAAFSPTDALCPPHVARTFHAHQDVCSEHAPVVALVVAHKTWMYTAVQEISKQSQAQAACVQECQVQGGAAVAAATQRASRCRGTPVRCACP